MVDRLGGVMVSQRNRIVLHVAASGPDLDSAELEELALQLRRDLLDLGLAEVRAVKTGPAPEGARSVELIAASVGFVITALSTAASVAQVAQFVAEWRAAHQSGARSR
jgi:hypothetical protein